MSYIIVGLGNPGEEYEGTRHNTGRLVLAKFEADWKLDKKSNALVAKTKIGKAAVTLVMPETMMNNSGKALTPLVKSKKQAEQLVVVYDDIDLPLGTMKVSFNRGDGGHRGLASIIKTIKTREFVRVRIGISPASLKLRRTGPAQKPKTEEAVIKFILGKFKESELQVLKKVFKKAGEAIEMIVTEGREQAMNRFNQ